ncbi:AIPR family protein [Rhizobium anhuiense]|uniref:AIPR family protein n=1 Tax=Rhizobium anhuiense TaxID=1184720 RepID=UPI0007B53E50|nr:AIPR family protein [Rhizobium anhuiense]KZS50689.1 abortive phage infection protein [Rhizobium anhuiense bv. trifolii]
MATLIDFSTVAHKVGEWESPELGIETSSKAFMPLMVSSLLDVTDEEAYDAITDGGKDRGIDALFVDERDGKNVIHLFQFKYAMEFQKSKSNFPSNEIDKLLSFLADLLDQDESMSKSCNPILWEKVKEAWLALNKKNPSIEIHFCSNTLPMLQDEQRRLRKALEKYNGVREWHHGLDEIINHFISMKKPSIDRDIRIIDKDYYERTDGNVRALICTIDAAELVKLIAHPDDDKTVYTSIFDENVRIYLSSRNTINKEIISTALSDERHLFWYLNNGLTITCSSFSYAKGSRGPVVSLKDVQIVNGGQTSNALFEAHRHEPDKVSDVLLLARIIEAKEQSIGHKVSETTNSQTPIKSRDLRANTLVQRKIEEALLAKGYFYERKTNQFADKNKDQRIDAQSAGQAYLAYALDMPEVAKKDRGRVFGDLFDTVYSDDLLPENLLMPLRVLAAIETFKKTVQRKLRKDEEVDPSDLFIIDGAYHVLFAVRRICAREGIDEFSGQALAKVEEAIKVVKSCVEKHRDETFSFNRFFKDAGTRTKIETIITAGS